MENILERICSGKNIPFLAGLRKDLRKKALNFK
jgi:hypothetical protein